MRSRFQPAETACARPQFKACDLFARTNIDLLCWR